MNKTCLSIIKTNMDLNKIKEIFKDYSDGIRVVYLVHRSKEGGSNNAQKRHFKKCITTNSEEFFNAVEEFKKSKDIDERPLRIYASLNSRDIKKAQRLFKMRMLEIDYADDEVRNKFYFDLKNQFVSCLADKSARESKNFMFDLDEIDDRSFHQIYNLLEKRTEIVLHYPTPHGWHIITKPFNYAKDLDNEYLIKALHADSLMLIDY